MSVHSTDHNPAATTEPAATPQSAIVFLLDNLPDVQTLTAAAPAGSTVVLLDGSGNALQQMADYLATLPPASVDAIHLLSHGSAGSLQLGSLTLTADNLNASADSLRQIGGALTEDGDILLYGCSVTDGQSGVDFIQRLARATGADVAASDDTTGSADLGGDWLLESRVGTVEANGLTTYNFDGVLALPGAHSGTVSGQVFLGGNYIELGISAVGSFGTTVSAPSGFYGTASSTQVGMSNDADGYDVGTDLRIDYFLPGSPEERWAIGYNGSSYGGFSAKNGNSGNATTLTGTSVSNNSSGNTLSATFDTTVQSTLDVTQVHTFQVSDKYFKTTVTITNVTGSTLTDVRFMRSFDPDNTVFKGGDFATVNKVENTYAADGKAVVSATSMAGDAYNTAAGSTAKILFFSSDPRAYASNFGFSNSNPYAAPEQAKGYTTTSDSAIAITFKLGTLAAGASATFEYYTSLDTADIADTIATIEAASNPAPTFTVFAAPIDTTSEDTQVELTFAELAAQGNEADQMPDPANVGSLTAGTVDAFVVTSVKTGSLKIGTDAGSATAWNPGTNDVIDATHKAYWTPAANANNTENGNTALNAFDVKARDTDGLLSSSAVTAKVNVTAVNDAPVIASAGTNVTLAAVNEDQATINGAAVSALVGPRFTDVDAGSSMGGIIIVCDASTADQGTWQYSTDGTNWYAVGTVADDNGLALPSTATLRFVPTENWNGTPGGLTVYVTDNLYAGGYTSGDTRDMETNLSASGVSTNTVNIVTTVNSINDLPVFTSDPGAASLTETSGWDDAVNVVPDEVGVASGSLTGTLTGSDVEGAVSFTIRGGTAGAGTVTKAGFYGTLVLDTSTNGWTYTPTNFTAINALAEGATATETFEFKITDSNGASATQELTISLTGTNDLPVLNAAIADQQFNGQGTFSYQIPANAFTDAEGLDLAYTVTLNGDTLGSEFSGDYSAGDPSTWMLFDEASRTLTSRAGVDLAGLMSSDLTVVVTATDLAAATATDTFTITLNPAASNANPAAPNIAPTTTDDHISLAASGTKVLALTDFGTFSDANGDSLASVKITSLPSRGTLEYSSNGSDWSNVTDEQVISAADITAGKLRYTAATDSTSFSFQVGDDNADGTAFSSDYKLTVDVTTTSNSIALSASDVTKAQAATWTNVYSSAPLSGFAGGDTVRIIVEATNGNVRLADATGVTAITTGYGSLTDGNATSIAFEGTLAQVNTALQQLQGNLLANPNMTLSISAVLGGSAYNPENGHYYQYVPYMAETPEQKTWTAAQTAAASSTFDGLHGYLVTITSDAENTFVVNKVGGNAWIGASDSETEGTWKWVTGPETGTLFFTGTNGGYSDSPYYNWQSGEPNNANDENEEDYGQIITVNTGSLVAGRWNDLPEAGGGGDYAVTGYVVEYGGMSGDPAPKAASATITLTKIPATPVLSLAGDANYTENAPAKALNPTILITDQDSTTLAEATVTISSGAVAGDALAFTNDNGVTYGNIAAAYNADTGVLTLQSPGSTATLAQWQAALQAVTFASTSDDPGASRTIQWQLTDPVANASNVATTSITVTEVNDAPTATALPDVDAVAGAALNIGIGNIFTDPESDTITYSAKLADGSDLPDWLSFNAETHIFSGNPPAGTPYLDLKVIGTDDGTPYEAAFTTFRLNLAQQASGAAASNNSGTITISDNNGASVALNDVLSASAPVDDDGYESADVVYQWQMRDKTGEATYGDWLDIAGATGQTFTVTQEQSSSQIRVQAFYTDAGGFAEAPVSNALTVPALNVAGTVTITGAVTPGQTLVATLSDANGLTTATPTYQWYRANDAVGTGKAAIGGATSSSYTLSNDDGGKYVSVTITYTDDEGTVETVSDTTDTAVQLGIVAPVASDDTGSATEAGGVDNATGGSNATGNLFDNDTDANPGDTKTLTALRSGNAEGLGTVGLLEGSEYVVSGDHGTLRVDKTTGAYTYTVNQWGWSIENLQSGQSLTDTFNYTVTDSTALSDMATLTVTISGANDAPTKRDLPANVMVVEDTKTAIPFSAPFALEDIDSTGDFTVILTASEGKLTGASGGGVNVSDSESGTLTLVGSLSAINTWLNTADTLYYTSAPNDNGVAGATLTLTAADANDSGNVNLGTVNVDITAANDAPILDLNADNSLAAGVVEATALTAGADLSGNNHAVVFRPRGSAVNVVDSDSLISDIDGDTTLVGATAEITAGAWDNSFTIYETLSSTAGGSYVGGSGTITITGNGTGTGGLTGATKLTLSGEASHADYQAALETIQYNNSLDSAFAGNRTVTISVLDKATADGGLASNAASFTIEAANANIAVGQMIYIGGVDSGHTVAQVLDSTHFVASGPLSALADGATLAFTLDGSDVTTAIAKADLAATGYVVSSASTLVQVLWTPVVDLNGNATSGTDHTTSFTEGGSGTYIATSDALVTDQDGNLASLTVLIENPLDAAADTMFLSPAVVSNLSANGITTTFYNAANAAIANGDAGVHKIVFSGDKDATYFQLGLRAVQYKNTSENPTVTPRTITTTIVDAAGNDGVPATTTINIVPVNDAPTLDTNSGDTVDEGEVVVIGSDNLTSSDVDDDDASLRYVVTDASDHGSLFRDSDGNGEIGTGEAISVDGSFTQGDVNAGVIKYAHDGTENFTDSFAFAVKDGMEDGVTAPTGTLNLTITPQNDAPVGLPTISGTLEPGQVLTADVSGISDGDGPDPLVFTYQWKADGNDIAGATESTYTLTTNESGKQITVAVTYEDTNANGGTDGTLTSAATDAVIFTNTAAGGSVTITNDGTPQAGEILTANTSAVTDADGLGPFSYQWQVSSDGGVTWGDVTGATARTFSLPVDATTGEQYQVIVSYTDGRGTAEELTSSAVTVVDPFTNTPASGAPTISGTLQPGEELAAGASLVTDADGMTGATLSYQWKAAGVSIDGATNNTYTLTGAEDGKAMTVTVSFTDDKGSFEQRTSDPTAAVVYVNHAPAGTVPLDNTSPHPGATITANPVELNDADGLGPFSYQWQQSTDGGSSWSNISDETARSYTLAGDADPATRYQVVVSYTDGLGTAESVASEIAIVPADLNNAPWLLATGENPTDGSALYSDVAVSTVEAGQLITGLTLTVTGLQNGVDEKLSIDGEAVSLTNVTGTTTTSSIGYAITVADNTATITLSHAGLTEAQAQTLVAGLSYSNAAGTPANGLRVVTLTGIQDNGGTAGGGVDSALLGISSTVNVGSIANTAPTVAGDLTATVDEADTLTLTLADLSATDPEHPVNGLTVIIGGAPTEGTLFLDRNTNGMADIGEALTSGGAFTLADIAAGRVRYEHDGVDAISNDSFTFTLSDGLAASNPASTFTITVTEVNDPPTLTVTSANPSFTEGGAAVALFTEANASTVEAGQNLTNLVLQISGLRDGAAEKLTVDGATFALTHGTNGTSAGSFTVAYSVSVTGGTATVTLTKPADAATWNGLINDLSYKNISENPTEGSRILNLLTLQDNGGGDDTSWIEQVSTVTVAAENDAPTIVSNAFTLLEEATHTLTLADLQSTDTDNPDASLTYTITTAPTKGALLLDGVALATDNTGTFTQQDIMDGRVSYAHSENPDPAGDSFIFTVSDGADGALAGQTTTITVTPVNDAPTLTTNTSAPTFTEGDAAIALFSATAASPVEAAQNLTELVLQITGLRDGAAEKLTVDGATFALTHGTNGTSAGSFTVAYSVSVTGGTATVTLTEAETGANWNTIVDGITYENSSQDPTTGDRAITLQTLTDNGGTANGGVDTSLLEQTSTVTIAAVNDTPTLTTATFTVNEGGSFTVTSTQINAADQDNALTDLIYTLSSAPTQGALYLDTNGNAQVDGSEALATNDQFTYANLSAGTLRYQHDGSENGDSFAITVGDGNSTSAAETVTVNRTPVNDAPTITNLGSDVLDYPANSGVKQVEQGSDVLITDPDSTDFAGGSLRVSIDFNRDPVHDVLSIANIGTGAGEVSAVGNAVSVGGTQIGTFTGGTGTADLVISFSAAAATPEAVNALVEAIRFSNDQAAPANPSRSISFTLNDGDGGQAAPVAVNVNILTGVTPSISIANGFFVIENTQLVTALSATDPNSRPITFSVSATVDADNNPDAGKFEIVSGNILRFIAAPDFETPLDAGNSAGDNVYKVIVRATNDIGSYAEQTLSVTVLDQNPEEGVAVGDTDGPVFGYATVNGTTLTMQYTDASNLDATNIPATSDFSVLVNGAVRAVTNVAVNATTKKVTLTLASAVTNGQTVTVSYTDPTAADDPAALQDIIGNDAASLVDGAVSNLTAAPPSSGGGSTGGGGDTGGGSTGGTTPPANNPPVITSGLEFTVPENQTSVTTVTATDADNNTIRFSITGGSDAARFTISQSGALSFTTAPDYETPTDSNLNNSYGVIVTASDGKGGTDNQSLLISVTDRNEAPTITSNGAGAVASVNVAENTSRVTTVTATDPDMDRLTYRISGGSDQAKFSIDPSTGVLSFRSAPDYENPTDADRNNSYNVSVSVQDGRGLTDSQSLSVVVTNVVETPTNPTDPQNPGDDADGDGSSDTVENIVPSLGSENGAAGDGNGDGVSDYMQVDVVSVPFRATNRISEQPNAPETFVSLVADSLAGKPSESGSALRQVQQLDAPLDLPEGIDMPLGRISFTAEIAETAGAESFSLYVDGDLRINGYWKQDAGGDWVNLASSAYGGQMVREGNRIRLDFVIEDGGAFDADGLANGVIVDPGAAGYVLGASVSGEQNAILQLCQAMFAAAPGAYYLSAFEEYLTLGNDLTDLANALESTWQFEQLMYDPQQSDRDFCQDFVGALVGEFVSAAQAQEGVDYLDGLLMQNWSRAEVMVHAAQGLSTLEDFPVPEWALAATHFNHQVAVSAYFSEDLRQSAFDLAQLQRVTAGLGADGAAAFARLDWLDGWIAEGMPAEEDRPLLGVVDALEVAVGA